jgi:hypothetical protein
MEDVNGAPYARLETAFKFRTTFTPSCSCKAQPWTAEAAERHRLFALTEARKQGDKAAATELSLLEAIREVRGTSPIRPTGSEMMADRIAPTSDGIADGPHGRGLLAAVEAEPQDGRAYIMRYTVPLGPVGVVLDATGRPAILKATAKPDQPPVVKIIARVESDSPKVETAIETPVRSVTADVSDAPRPAPAAAKATLAPGKKAKLREARASEPRTVRSRTGRELTLADARGGRGPALAARDAGEQDWRVAIFRPY